MKSNKILSIALTLVLSMGMVSMAWAQKSVQLTADQMEELVLRAYVPDLEKFNTWTPPKAKMLR